MKIIANRVLQKFTQLIPYFVYMNKSMIKLKHFMLSIVHPILNENSFGSLHKNTFTLAATVE